MRPWLDIYRSIFDGLGSVAAITNASGLITHGYDYDPFGVTTVGIDTPAVPNPWRYASQYQDPDTGLYKMGARYYQPELGRWTQPDPSGADANAYLYVGGNPVNFVDPSGLFCVFGTYGGPGGGCRGGNIGPEDDKTLALGAIGLGALSLACAAGAGASAATVIGLPASALLGACSAIAAAGGLAIAGYFYLRDFGF